MERGNCIRVDTNTHINREEVTDRDVLRGPNKIYTGPIYLIGK